MTANCPRCGGKFDVEERDFTIYIPAGDRVEINCRRCETILEYHLDLKQVKKFYLEELSKFYEAIEELEEGTRKEFLKKLETVTIDRILKRRQ